MKAEIAGREESLTFFCLLRTRGCEKPEAIMDCEGSVAYVSCSKVVKICIRHEIIFPGRNEISPNEKHM